MRNLRDWIVARLYTPRFQGAARIFDALFQAKMAEKAHGYWVINLPEYALARFF
jgi:hypothetical protein